MAPSLEIRINSVHDAKAVVTDLINIHKRITELGAASVELKISEECVKEANKILYGVFRVKVFTKVITTPENSILYVPPPLVLHEELV